MTHGRFIHKFWIRLGSCMGPCSSSELSWMTQVIHLTSLIVRERRATRKNKIYNKLLDWLFPPWIFLLYLLKFRRDRHINKVYPLFFNILQKIMPMWIQHHNIITPFPSPTISILQMNHHFYSTFWNFIPNCTLWKNKRIFNFL